MAKRDKNEIIVELVEEHFEDHAVVTAEDWSEILYLADAEMYKKEKKK